MMLLALVCMAPMATKKVKTITVDELYQMSQVIATAKVESISAVSGVKVATAKIIKIFKGKPVTDHLKFVAQQTWTCDISTAIKGETILLYLSPVTSSLKEQEVTQLDGAASELALNGFTLYSIGHSGRGRLALTSVKGAYAVAAYFESSTLGDDWWRINTELNLPNGKKVKRKGEDKGFISLPDLLTYR